MNKQEIDWDFVLLPGKKKYMEDFISFDLDFPEPGQIFGGVYDGHGGHYVAETTSKRIQNVFQKCQRADVTVAKAFKDTYKEIHNSVSVLKLARDCGTCAANFLIQDGVIHHANVGDARIVVVGEELTELTEVHRPGINPHEMVRIMMANGEMRNGYIFADPLFLQVSRSIGDQSFKRHGVICEPTVGSYTVKPTDRFLIAGTDGLFDPVSLEQILALSQQRKAASSLAHVLKQEVSASKNGGDNLAIIVLKL